jgi:hypothetical protein
LFINIFYYIFDKINFKDMRVEKEEIEKILSKMSSPLHYSYVSRYILKCEDIDAVKILDKLVDDNLLKRVKSEGYYVIS